MGYQYDCLLLFHQDTLESFLEQMRANVHVQSRERVVLLKKTISVVMEHVTTIISKDKENNIEAKIGLNKK